MSPLCRDEGDGVDYRGRDEKRRAAMPSLRRRHGPCHCQESPTTTTLCASKSSSNAGPWESFPQMGRTALRVIESRLENDPLCLSG